MQLQHTLYLILEVYILNKEVLMCAYSLNLSTTLAFKCNNKNYYRLSPISHVSEQIRVFFIPSIYKVQVYKLKMLGSFAMAVVPSQVV